MNRMKYRVCLIALALAAVLFGVLYYVYGEKEEGPYTGGTLVWRETEPLSCLAIVLEPEKEVLL